LKNALLEDKKRAIMVGELSRLNIGIIKLNGQCDVTECYIVAAMCSIQDLQCKMNNIIYFQSNFVTYVHNIIPSL